MQHIKVPLLLSSKTVVLGGTVAGLTCALMHAKLGEEVLLIEQGTCLYKELDRSGCYALPETPEKNDYFNSLFPEECLAQNALMHPDKLKRYGEHICKQWGIRLLYAAQALTFFDDHLLIAHKSGLYGISCSEIYDCRYPLVSPEGACRLFCLHIMDLPVTFPAFFKVGCTLCEGSLSVAANTTVYITPGAAGVGHGVMQIPIMGEKNSDAARDRYEVYALSLAAFTQAKQHPALGHITLARSGLSCLNHDILLSINLGLNCQPGFLQTTGAQEKDMNLSYLNPLYPEHPADVLMPDPQTVWQGDVVVAGGGTSGAVAALSAARQGMSVLLIEMNGMLGGTATCGGVSTYWFGTRDGATAMIDREVDSLYQKLKLPRKPCLWSEHDIFLPDLKAHALLSLCLKAGVKVVFDACVCAAVMQDGIVKGVAYACDGGYHQAKTEMVIDATGDADVAMLAGVQHRYGTDRSALTYWASLAQYLTPCTYKNNFSTMVHVGCPLDYTRFIIAGRKLGDGMYDHGSYVALRESRHIKSRSDVSLTDLLAMKTPPDTLYQCFSNYDPKGLVTSDLVYWGLLPPNLLMNVPLGAMFPLNADGSTMRGLLVGGKAIGCSHDALPGLRMQPDLQQQGFALGILAAQAIKQHVDAWEAEGVPEAIEAAGGQKIRDLPADTLFPQSMAAALTGEETLEWLDMPPDQAVTAQLPEIACFLAPRETLLPGLKKLFDKEPDGTKKKLLLARLMLWHGDGAGAAVVIKSVTENLNDSPQLPPRVGPTTFGQLLPDHGLMPETVYLLNTLAWCSHPDKLPLYNRVLDKLINMPRDWQDIRSGIYCYAECFAYAAVRSADRVFIPMLHAILNLPELKVTQQQDLLMAQRFAMLELSMAEALACLGEPGGFELLQDLRNHPVAVIALSADSLAKELSLLR